MPLNSLVAYVKTAVKQLHHCDPQGINFFFQQVDLDETHCYRTELKYFFILLVKCLVE